MSPSQDARRRRIADWLRSHRPGAISGSASLHQSNAEPGFDDLLRDVTAMATSAAQDGLPLPLVFEDLRDLLDVDTGAELPAELASTAALAWARAHRPDPRSVAATADLEDHLWRRLVDLSLPTPTALLVVTLRARPEPGRTSAMSVEAFVAAEEMLPLVAHTLAPHLNRSGELVTLHQAPSSGHSVVAALLVGDDVTERHVMLSALIPARVPDNLLAEIRVHPLDHHVDGPVAALNHALREEDS